MAYQRFLYKGLYAGVHVMNSWQKFNDKDKDNKQVGTGFQIFNTYRLGYQIKLFKNKFFIEPSVAVTHRHFQTKMPLGFDVNNNRWPKYFIGEPGLYFGFNF